MLNHTTKPIITFILLLALVYCSPKAQQFTPQKLQKSIHENQFTLTYFYSSSCQYCSIFTPKFEQVAKIYQSYDNITVLFGKIDGPGYQQVNDKYGITSYPSVALFWKGIDLPIFFRKQREVANLLQFLKHTTVPLKTKLSKEKFQSLPEEQKNSAIVFNGPMSSIEHNITTVLSYLQPYYPFVLFDENVSEASLNIKGVKMESGWNDAEKIRREIRAKYAKVHQIDQQAWLGIFEQKRIGIVYVDTEGNKKVTKILQKIVNEYPDLIFLRLHRSDEQFRDALGHLGFEQQENLFGVNEKVQGKFIADKPYTQQSIRNFIKLTIDSKATLYLRSQKTTHKQKLTRQNFEQKVLNDPKDVIVFFYRDTDRLQAKFMDLFKFLTLKLKQNKNLSLLRCNLSKNEIQMKLGFEIKMTPSIIYYGHRMKDRPIHFSQSTISTQSVIEFIMQNTTFDWQQEWSEL